MKNLKLELESEEPDYSRLNIKTLMSIGKRSKFARFILLLMIIGLGAIIAYGIGFMSFIYSAVVIFFGKVFIDLDDWLAKISNQADDVLSKRFGKK